MAGVVEYRVQMYSLSIETVGHLQTLATIGPDLEEGGQEEEQDKEAPLLPYWL